MRTLLSLLVLASISPAAIAGPGRIIAIGDEWLLSDEAFIQQAAQTQQLASNISAYFHTTGVGHYLVLSNSPAIGGVTGQRGVLGTSLASAMAAAGNTWTVNPPIPFTVAALSNYDAVFFSGGFGSGVANATVLTEYVNAGGSVLVMSGTGDIGSPDAEANAWNPFLHNFGIGFASSVWFGLGASLLNVPTQLTANPLGASLSSVLWGYGQFAVDIDPANPGGEVALYGNFTGFNAPPPGDVAHVPIIATYNIPSPICLADIAGGPIPGAPDDIVDGVDFIAFINAFGAGDKLADVADASGVPPGDGIVDGNDFVAFVNAFAAGC